MAIFNLSKTLQSFLPNLSSPGTIPANSNTYSKPLYPAVSTRSDIPSANVNYNAVRQNQIQGPGLGWHGDYVNAGTTSGGGGGGGAGFSYMRILKRKIQRGGSPQVNMSSQAQEVDPLFAEIDNIANEAYGVLSTAESNLRSQQTGIESDISSRAAANTQEVRNQEAMAGRQIAGEEALAGQRRESALSSARRMYNELQMGGQQRFGGASSAGQAYSELTGREFMRNQGDITTNFQNAMNKFSELKANLTDRIQLALQKIQTDTSAAINQARRDFDNKLLEITRLRADVGANKAQMRLDALQNLRNQIYQINLAKVNDTQSLNTLISNLNQQQQALVSQMGQTGTQATQNTQAFNNQTTTNPVTAYNVSAANQFIPTYTGRITSGREEELSA